MTTTLCDDCKGLLITDAPSVAVRIADSGAVRKLAFLHYLPKPHVEERLRTKRPIAKEDFSDVFKGTEDAGTKLKTLLLHKGEATRVRVFSASDVTAELLKQLADERSGDVLALYARPQVRKGRHIPMMDFLVKPSAGEDNAVRDTLVEAMRECGQREGFLLESGESFHYCGLEPLSDEEWRVFMGRCMLLGSLVDGRYVGHRLISGRCSLRLSEVKTKTRVRPVPQVVACLH